MQKDAKQSHKIEIPFSTLEGGLMQAYPLTEDLSLERATDFIEAVNKKGGLVIATDNSNFARAGRGNGNHVDYHSVITVFGGERLVLASIAVSEPPFERKNQAAFYDFLERIGWCVHRFALLVDGYGRCAEDEFHVDGQVRDTILSAARSSEVSAVLVLSGDGGMTNAVKTARRAGKDVFVIAWRGSLHPALAAAATAHISVEELLPFIGRVLH